MLGVGPVIRDVFVGEATITRALDELRAARERWPGTSEDWVAVVDATAEQVESLREVAQTQLEAMRSLEESLGIAVGEDGSWYPPDLPNPVDRILNADELELLGHVDEWYAEIAAAHEREADDAEDEAEEAEADFEEAAADLAEAEADAEAAAGGESEDEDGEW
ncbi:MAG: hypothetical protein ABI649_10225 [Gaiellaceae bacterium]